MDSTEKLLVSGTQNKGLSLSYEYAMAKTVSFYSDGKKAVIDFSGESVTYSGDMPVDESARIFFNAVFSHFKEV